jgi:TPR repeat protein
MQRWSQKDAAFAAMSEHDGCFIFADISRVVSSDVWGSRKRGDEARNLLMTALARVSSSYTPDSDGPTNVDICIPLMRKAAELGNVAAMFALHGFLEDSDGETNREESKKWLRKAARGGFPTAMEEYASDCVSTDKCSEALELFKKRAEAGHSRKAGLCAQSLGWACLNGWMEGVGLDSGYQFCEGEFVPFGTLHRTKVSIQMDGVPVTPPPQPTCTISRNAKEALQWFRLGSETGDLVSMNALALMYEVGCGTKPDNANAVHLYQQAIKAGSCLAQENMARMYENGLGGLARDEARATELRKKLSEDKKEFAQVITNCNSFMRRLIAEAATPRD